MMTDTDDKYSSQMLWHIFINFLHQIFKMDCCKKVLKMKFIRDLVLGMILDINWKNFSSNETLLKHFNKNMLILSRENYYKISY